MTQVLSRLNAGETGASSELLALVYDELRALARSRMASLPAGHTLQPTALVHEAYLKLVGDDAARFESRAHFFGAAARAMRNILVDHARGKYALKRGGEGRRLALDAIDPARAEPDVDLLALHEALDRLEQADPAKAQVVMLRYFAGLSIPQIAEALGVSPSTVDRQWHFARVWLKREMQGTVNPGDTGR